MPHVSIYGDPTKEMSDGKIIVAVLLRNTITKSMYMSRSLKHTLCR